MTVGARKRSAKTRWVEFRINLEGRRRPDGSLFVTSSNLKPFSAVLEDGNWEAVKPFLERFLEVNFGRVRDLRLIRDAAELLTRDLDIPPAYIIAELTPDRVGAR
jgi:hypothetical protein